MNFISIALPVYNGENFLEEALESICAQDYDDYEVIVADNNSKDKTAEILERFAKRNHRIKIYRSEYTLLQHENVNRTLHLCTGNWVQFLCHDDIMLPGCLSYLNEVLERNKGNEHLALIGHEDSWLFSNGYVHNPYYTIQGRTIYKWEEFRDSGYAMQFKEEDMKIYRRKQVIEQILDGKEAPYIPALTTALVKKRRLQTLGAFNGRYMHFDVFAWYQLLVYYDYVLINRPLTVTRIHSSQIAVGARKSLRTISDFKLYWREFYERNKDVIRFNYKRKLYIYLKPLSTSAGLISIELVRRNIRMAFQTLKKLPLSWYPLLMPLILRSYMREKARVRELHQFVPFDEVYP